jgi:3-oxoacyl-[acyl-carrier protein] reductase
VNNSKPLEGEVALVTGAGRGIGRAIDLGYVEAGALVGCTARTSVEIEGVAAEICAAGGQAVAITADVADAEVVQLMIAKVTDQLGGLDIAVLNAGVHGSHSPVEGSYPGPWQRDVEVNLFGAYHCARAVIPYLKARGSGKIITIGSGVGHRGPPGGSAYAEPKAALWMLTRVLGQELAQYDISVNEFIPGPVETSINPNASQPAGSGQTEWSKNPEEVVPLALFLATQSEVGPTAQSFSLMRRDG